MSDFKHKSMTGSLWNNQYKERDSHPDMTGKLVIGEKTYSVGAWKNITKNGAEYIKISLSDENLRPNEKPEGKSYQSVGESVPSKHLSAYQKAKEGITEEEIIKDEDIPF